MSANSEPLSPAEVIDDLRYRRAIHGVQSAIALGVERGDVVSTTPKHLRTGIDACFVSNDAVQHLLIEKGIVTRADIFRANADAAERELALREQEWTGRLGMPVRFTVPLPGDAP